MVRPLVPCALLCLCVLNTRCVGCRNPEFEFWLSPRVAACGLVCGDGGCFFHSCLGDKYLALLVSPPPCMHACVFVRLLVWFGCVFWVRGRGCSCAPLVSRACGGIGMAMYNLGMAGLLVAAVVWADADAQVRVRCYLGSVDYSSLGVLISGVGFLPRTAPTRYPKIRLSSCVLFFFFLSPCLAI